MNIFTILREKKDHIINKLNLTDEQKNELISFFKKRPDLETKIDWNNKELKYEDFAEVLANISKSNAKKTKGSLIPSEFVEGKDYIDISLSDTEVAFIPLNYDFQKFIQNKSFYGTEAKWCIGSNDRYYWEHYQDISDFIILIDTTTGAKIAWQVTFRGFYFWNSEDQSVEVFDISDIEYFKYWADVLEIEKSFIEKLVSENKLQKFLDKFDQFFANDTTNALDEDSIYLDILDFDTFEGYFVKGGQQIKRRVNQNFEEVYDAEAQGYSNLIVKTNPNTFIKKCLKKELESIRIPKGIRIPDLFFAHCANLSYVQLPETFKVIDDRMFEYCYDLNTIDLSLDLEEIGECAFQTTAIKKFEAPASLRKLGKGCFYNCDKLELIDLSKTKLKIIPKNFADNCKKLTTVLLPDTIEEIHHFAFANTPSLSIIDTKNVKKIESFAFENSKADILST